MFSETIQVALIAGGMSTAGMVITLWLTNRGKREQQEAENKSKSEAQAAEWARQDKVAAQSKADVEAALARTDEVARIAKEQATQLRVDTARAEARADEVAKVARETARLLSIDTANAARRTEEVAVDARRTAELLVASDARQTVDRAATAAKLDQIDATGKVTHALVNSNMTQSKETTLDALKAQLVLLLEVAALKTEQGKPSGTAGIAMALEKRIAALEAELVDREAQQKKVDASAAAGSHSTPGEPLPVSDAAVQGQLSSSA